MNRRAAGISAREPKRRSSPGERIPLDDRDALHVLGLSEGPPHPPGGLQRPVADDLADALGDDDAALARREHGSRLVLPVVPARRAPARVRGPGALDEAARRAVHRGRLPANGRSAATKSGRPRTATGAAPRRAVSPGGAIASTEQMTLRRRRREPGERPDGRRRETTITLPDRKLSWKVHLEVTSDATELSLQARAQAAKGRRAHSREGVGGDDCSGQPLTSDREGVMPISTASTSSAGGSARLLGHGTLPDVRAHFDALRAIPIGRATSPCSSTSPA